MAFNINCAITSCLLTLTHRQRNSSRNAVDESILALAGRHIFLKYTQRSLWRLCTLLPSANVSDFSVLLCRNCAWPLSVTNHSQSDSCLFFTSSWTGSHKPKQLEATYSGIWSMTILQKHEPSRSLNPPTPHCHLSRRLVYCACYARHCGAYVA